MSNTVLMMAGGTGGHVIPALSVANALAQKGYAIEWLGTAQGIESQLVPQAGYPLHCLTISGLRGKGKLGLFVAPWRITKAVLQALKLIKKLQPFAVVGFGGYATGPGGVAAKLAGVPLLIHEQNAVAGLTNKLLRPVSNVVMQAFPAALKNALTVGNPVRAEVAAIAEPAARLQANSQAPLKVLVVGGSLGAVAVNQLVLEAMQQLPAEIRPQLHHQVGKGSLETMQAAYQTAGLTVQVSAFISDMAEAYCWADLVICRAGALTVAEIAAAGCAALFIPFPFAVDDHQTANANYLVSQQAALMHQQKDLTAAKLAAEITQLHHNRGQLIALASKARQLAITTATDEVIAQIERFKRG